MQPFANNSICHSSLHIDQHYLNRNFTVSALASANVAATISFVQFIMKYHQLSIKATLNRPSVNGTLY
ncbi:hypothetical protein D5289_09270 [Lactiplantibacillus plantarum]|uniref:Uncharacterized protein n=1 Tax=Lactiplantibacillus argentoratensis TaxID=271881 RepID=A0AAN1Q3N8_9LACO|nr:hypothetical protein D5289_09270 [Lactiplantibacillus plantarum]AYJ37099.1 hypothetical protein LPA65_13510 [Lactiplantibacillus argentoratensis]MPQ37413.1 hypothetical protein [Lactiplantibacillus plantarum]MZU92684.1 hypothetical protein [Lactiplantibacillus plantarum]